MTLTDMALKVLNKEEKEFSDEFLMLMAIVAYSLYAAEMVMYKAARTCDIERLKDSFFQKKKQRVGQAAKHFRMLLANLEAFDPWFDKIQRGRLDYCNFVQQNASDLVTLMILYYSRTENHPERRQDIFKAIRQMPVDDSADYEAILDYFHIKL